MPSDVGCYPFACVLFRLLCLLLCRLWRRGTTTPSARKPPRPTREPQPFAGLTYKPDCEAGEQGGGSHPQAPWADQGWVGFGNRRANGHPHGRRWRQLLCLGCNGYVLETTGTPFHAKQVEPDRLVRAMAALAEGLGIRHQGLDNHLIVPGPDIGLCGGQVAHRQRLGGLLTYYHRDAA